MGKKNSQLIRALALSVIVCLMVPAICIASPKKHREQGVKERNEALWMINNINNFCKKLTEDIKTLEAADSLNDIVWKQRDSLDKLSKDTLELFIGKLVSVEWYAPDNIAVINTAMWTDNACKQVVANANKYNSIKQFVIKTYDDILWKKQRMFDMLLTITEYSKAPAETSVETVKRMLESSETCSFIGKQHLYYINLLKGALEVLKKMNSKNKELMKVTDGELSEMFADDPV